MPSAPLENRHIAAARVKGLVDEPVRRDASGAIDFDYYLERGRRERSRAFIAALRGLGAALSRLLARPRPRRRARPAVAAHC